MQIGRFTSEQSLAVLAAAEEGGATISELCRQHNSNRSTFLRWRKAYGPPVRPRAPKRAAAATAGGGGESGGRDEADLAGENARLKRLLAERDLEVDLLKQALGKRW